MIFFPQNWVEMCWNHMISYCVTCLTLEALSYLFTHLSSSWCVHSVNSKCDLPEKHQMHGIEDLDFHTQRVTIDQHVKFKKISTKSAPSMGWFSFIPKKNRQFLLPFAWLNQFPAMRHLLVIDVSKAPMEKMEVLLPKTHATKPLKQGCHRALATARGADLE